MSLLACLLVLGAAQGLSVFLWNPWPRFALAEIFEFLEKSKTISWWFQFLNELLLQYFSNLLVKIHFVLEQPTFKVAASSCSPLPFTSDLCRGQSNAINLWRGFSHLPFIFPSCTQLLQPGVQPSSWQACRVRKNFLHNNTCVFQNMDCTGRATSQKKQLSKLHFLNQANNKVESSSYWLFSSHSLQSLSNNDRSYCFGMHKRAKQIKISSLKISE